jgi:N-acetylglucosaminyl-diphospho-decaprenol L-rhamnosyltransferase
MAEPLELSIIIVNWNSAAFVRQCVSSIRSETTGLTYEILVIDNASFDGCEKMLSAHDPAVRYLQSQKNVGFARANNLAFEAARGASLLFLNPDTEVAGPAIQRLHRALRELPAAGVVGARLLNGDGSLQTTCIQSFPTIVNQMLDFECLRRLWPESELWGMAPLHRTGRGVDEVEVVSGACLMIGREMFERVGRFSEDYFMYAEDLDLCHKVRRAGGKNYYVPEASVVHFGGSSSSSHATSNFSSVMMRESVWRFLRKTRGEFYGLSYRGSILVAACCRLGLLGACFPLQALRRRQRVWSGSFRKWWAILLWSLRRVEWVKQYS